MGKTGSVEWVQIKKRKERKGRSRLVTSKMASHKRPAPGQKFDSKGNIRRKMKRSPSSIMGVKGRR